MRWYTSFCMTVRRRFSFLAALIACALSAPVTVAASDVEHGAVPLLPALGDPGILRYPRIVARRDPFEEPPALNGAYAIPSLPMPGVPNFALPPNLGAPSDIEGSKRGAVVLKATAIGDAAKALLDIDGRSTLVGIGSRVGDATITQIDANDVRLSDGTTLRLRNTPK
jgi:hypothetical protein